jgi:hypothetical protein
MAPQHTTPSAIIFPTTPTPRHPTHYIFSQNKQRARHSPPFPNTFHHITQHPAHSQKSYWAGRSLSLSLLLSLKHKAKRRGGGRGERSTKIEKAAFISVGFKPFSFFEYFPAKSGNYNRYRLYLLT